MLQHFMTESLLAVSVVGVCALVVLSFANTRRELERKPVRIKSDDGARRGIGQNRRPRF